MPKKELLVPWRHKFLVGEQWNSGDSFTASASPFASLLQQIARYFSFAPSASPAASNASSSSAPSGTPRLAPVSQVSTDSNAAPQNSDDSDNNSTYDSANLFPPMKNTSSANSSAFTALNSRSADPLIPKTSALASLLGDPGSDLAQMLDDYFNGTYGLLLGPNLLDADPADPLALTALLNQFSAVDENGDPILDPQDGSEDPSTQSIQYVDSLTGSQPAAGLAAMAQDALQRNNAPSAPNSSSSDSSATT